jgi:hypothetical protein
MERIGGFSSLGRGWGYGRWSSHRRATFTGLAEFFEVGILGFGFDRKDRSRWWAANRWAEFTIRSWRWKCWNSRRGWWRRNSARENLAGSRCRILRGDLLRSLLIRRIFITKTLKLKLKVSFSFTGFLKLCSLSCELGFLLLGFTFRGLLATLLFLLLYFPLFDLLFECLQSSLRRFLFFGEFVFLTLCLIPSEMVS